VRGGCAAAALRVAGKIGLMKSYLALLIFLSAISQLNAQQSLGFSPTASTGSTLKLSGIVILQAPGGYLVVSVPAKDIGKFVLFIAKHEPHMAALELLERAATETRKLKVIPGPPTVPLGECFLATDENLPRHKILNRNVQIVGTYGYVDRHGETVTVKALSGGPIDLCITD
jgi:hypothetical protein